MLLIDGKSMLMRRVLADQRDQQGMALLLVLWAIAILGLISAVFTTMTRTETNRTRNLVESAKAEGLADAGIYRAIAVLLEADPDNQPLIDGSIYRWQFDQSEILISMQSEAGKIDLNTASDQILEGLFLSAGVEQGEAHALVDAIRDFSDEDDLRRLVGAEDTEYHAVGLVDGAKDGPFDRVAELRQVLNVDSDLYDTVAPVLTVYSGGRSVDPSTASPAALLALPGATQAQIDEIVAARSGGSQSDDNDLGTSRHALPMLGDPMEDEEAPLSQAVRQRAHPVLTITASATTAGGGAFERLAIVRLTGDPLQPFVIHEWRQVWDRSDTATNDGNDPSE